MEMAMDQMTVYRCRLCSRIYLNPSAFKVHVIEVHPNYEYKYGRSGLTLELEPTEATEAIILSRSIIEISSDSDDSSIYESATEANVDEEEKAVSYLKRGPGRPSTKSKIHKADTEVMKSSVKRGPGRPSKSLTKTSKMKEISIKRGRGRSSLNKTNIKTSKMGEITIKRGRGRPSNSLNKASKLGEISIKRGRGRPSNSMNKSFEKNKGQIINKLKKRGPGRPSTLGKKTLEKYKKYY